jgi:FixJ family two-component response regulator
MQRLTPATAMSGIGWMIAAMDMTEVRDISSAQGWSRLPGESTGLPESPIVFACDGDHSVRRSVELLGERAGWRVQTFASAGDFLACPRALAPSCLVLETGLCDMDGLALQKRLVDRPEMPIVFLSGSADLRTAVRAMKAGAFEFLSKPLVDHLLAWTIRDAMQRSRAVLARQSELEALRARYLALSSRERDIMALVVCGRLNKQAAAELGISEITVKAHRGKVMRKMGASSVPELVNMAAKLFPAA